MDVCIDYHGKPMWIRTLIYKYGKPYRMVVSLRGDRGDVCVDCIAGKSYEWVDRYVISSHRYLVWDYRNKEKKGNRGIG